MNVQNAEGNRVTFDAAGPLDVDHGDVLVEAALADVGVVQVLDFMIDDHLRAGRLVEVLAESAAPGPTLHAVHPKRPLPRVVRSSSSSWRSAPPRRGLMHRGRSDERLSSSTTLFRLLRRVRRNRETEGAPDADPTLCPDPTAVAFDDALGDEEPQPDAAGPVRLALPVPIEEVGHLICRYSRTVVGHGEANVAGPRPRT